MTSTARSGPSAGGREQSGPIPDTALRFLSWVWLGLVVGVSLIATPAKFQADSLELDVALDVGRTTFALLARIQWALLLGLVLVALRARKLGRLDNRHVIAVAAIATILVVQATWILPELNDRVAIVIGGGELPDSPIHYIFAIFEGAKLMALGLLGYLTARSS